MHGEQLSSPTEELKPRRHFIHGDWPFFPKNPFLQMQSIDRPTSRRIEPAGHASTATAEGILTGELEPPPTFEILKSGMQGANPRQGKHQLLPGLE